MAIVAAAFYTVADRMHHGLPLSPTLEECSRTVAGRLYYSAYLATRETLRQLAKNPKYKIDHTPLVNFLRYEVDDTWVEEFGITLDGLRLLRVRADYHPDALVEHRAVGTTLKDAKFILDQQPELFRRLNGRKLPTESGS